MSQQGPAAVRAPGVEQPHPPSPQHRRIALVGNPNVGKSVVFGALTGTYATVSNYPGTTVEVTRARARFDPEVEVIDTPGVNGLTPQSEDEKVTRDILLAGVDAVVQVADAKNLARALALSAQLAEAGLPFVLVLNMTDEATDRGLTVDAAALSAELGVPVVQTVAVSGVGLRELVRALPHAARGNVHVHYPPAVDVALLKVQRVLPSSHQGRRWLALMCLAGDATLGPWLERHTSPSTRVEIEGAHAQLRAQLGRDVGYALARCRSRAGERLARAVTRRDIAGRAAAANGRGMVAATAAIGLAAWLALLAGDLGLAPALAAPGARVAAWLGLALPAIEANRSPAMRAALARWAGAPGSGVLVLLVVLYVVYCFVGAFAAGTVVDFLDKTVFGAYLNPAVAAAVDRVLGTSAGAAANAGPGPAAAQLLRNLLVGPYGLVTMALTYAIAIILPIVTAFFLAFSVLEDSGYLPRLAIVVNHTFRAMGLNGKAVLPMVLGLGCDTMATLTARILETRKERVLVTLLLALGVPCSAQLGVTLGLLGALPWWAPVVWGGVVVGVLLAVGFLAAQLLPGRRSDLILELPPIRRPRLSNIAVKTVGRLEWYLKEAVPVFMLGTLVLFLLDAVGLLGWIIRASEPAVVGLLHLPARTAEAFLIGFFRRDYGSAGLYAMFQEGLLSPVQAVVALVTITLFVPCVANFFVIVKEHGARTALAMSGFIFPFAFLVGAAVNLALRAADLQ